jgi:hypothetical protein
VRRKWSSVVAGWRWFVGRFEGRGSGGVFGYIWRLVLQSGASVYSEIRWMCCGPLGRCAPYHMSGNGGPEEGCHFVKWYMDYMKSLFFSALLIRSVVPRTKFRTLLYFCWRICPRLFYWCALGSSHWLGEWTWNAAARGPGWTRQKYIGWIYEY